MNNVDLKFDIDKILSIQDSIETDSTKVAVNKTEDFNLDYPYAIDVEDSSYFYVTEYERDIDYETLLKILTTRQRKKI